MLKFPQSPLRTVKFCAPKLIVGKIHRESQAAYVGNCACPDNLDRRGYRCGKRSAYNRPGGEAPLGNPSDVSAEMVAMWKSKHATATAP